MKMIKVTVITTDARYNTIEVEKYINTNYIGVISPLGDGSNVILAMNYNVGCTNPSYVYEVKETPEEIIKMIEE